MCAFRIQRVPIVTVEGGGVSPGLNLLRMPPSHVRSPADPTPRRIPGASGTRDKCVTPSARHMRCLAAVSKHLRVLRKQQGSPPAVVAMGACTNAVEAKAAETRPRRGWKNNRKFGKDRLDRPDARLWTRRITKRQERKELAQCVRSATNADFDRCRRDVRWRTDAFMMRTSLPERKKQTEPEENK